MKQSTKALLVASVLSGLVAGQAKADEKKDDSKPAAAKEMKKDKDSCHSKNSCKSKEKK